MFFKKKTPAPKPATRAEQRAQYRKRNSKSQSIEATLRVPKWEPLRVELVDLSVRGACIRIPFAQDRNLKVDDVVEISIGSMMRSEVHTAARVANIGREGESHLRYGLEFVNINNLYAQLDSFYARQFNRRRNARVVPTLDRKVQVKARWGSDEVSGHVFDISESGMGLVLTKDSSARVAEVEALDVTMRLPGIDVELSGRARIRHRASLNQHTLLGLEFDLETPEGFARFTTLLTEFVARRAAEMALWEKSWS